MNLESNKSGRGRRKGDNRIDEIKDKEEEKFEFEALLEEEKVELERWLQEDEEMADKQSETNWSKSNV